MRRKKLHRLAEFSLGEWLLLLQLTTFSLTTEIGLWLVALPRLTDLIARCAQNRWLRHFPLLHERYAVRQLTTLADLAARVTHGQERCLPRSLLLFWLCKARGEPAALLIGISKEAAALQGHAWVETQGGVIGDSVEMTRRFALLHRF